MTADSAAIAHAREAARIMRARSKHAGPIDVDGLAAQCGILVERGELIGAVARLTSLPGGGVIRLAAAESISGRDRFSIAHEIGHAVLHPAVGPCTEEDLTDLHSDKGREREANAFAAELLMPQLEVRRFLGRRAYNPDAVRDIADRFKVSLTSAAIAGLEATTEACALLMCDRTKVRWRTLNDEFMLRIKPMVPAQSQVRSYVPGAPWPSGQTMDVEDWCEKPPPFGRVELFEEIIPLPKIDAALVILTRQKS